MQTNDFVTSWIRMIHCSLLCFNLQFSFDKLIFCEIKKINQRKKVGTWWWKTFLWWNIAMEISLFSIDGFIESKLVNSTMVEEYTKLLDVCFQSALFISTLVLCIDFFGESLNSEFWFSRCLFSFSVVYRWKIDRPQDFWVKIKGK
jgi:hypothetical protein